MEKTPKNGKSEANRVNLILLPIMAEKYPGVLYSAGYDVQTDRIEIRVANAVAIELGPKEWFFGDEEVRDLLTAKLHNVVRANLPQ